MGEDVTTSEEAEVVYDGIPPAACQDADTLGRVTVVESVYHREPGETPLQYDSRYSVPVNTEESCYERRLKVSESPQRLGLGDLTSISQILIRSIIPRAQRNLSEEEKEEQAASVLELSCESIPLMEIHPGESVRFTPVEDAEYWIRCRSGSTRFHLVVLPR